jgi:hypothetical protein
MIEDQSVMRFPGSTLDGLPRALGMKRVWMTLFRLETAFL